MPARDMASYMRERRARQRTEKSRQSRSKAAIALGRLRPTDTSIDIALPHVALVKASKAELATVHSKLAATGPAEIITKTGDRLDVLAPKAFEARQNAAPTSPRTSAPRSSMRAVGGTPGSGLIAQGNGYALPPDQAALSTFTLIQAKTEVMLAALVARSDMQEQRIAALEAQASDRKAQAVDIAQAFFGVLRYTFVNSR